MIRKSLKLWLEELPPSVYDKAIANIEPRKLQYEFGDGAIALDCAFDFSKSPEGLAYWSKVIEIYL